MEKVFNEKTTVLKKSTPKDSDKGGFQFGVNYSTGLLPPPNPLIQRKHIPLNSPKFGKSANYIKLLPFRKEEKESEEFYQIQEKENLSNNSPNNSINSEEKFEKNCELNFYINSSWMLEKLIYLRNELTKESKINLDNIVNLKKKSSDIPPLKKNKILKPFYSPTNSTDPTLIFESRFESGNLLASFKVNENSYQMLIQNDTNTSGYSQWFFFRVSNTKKGVNAKFNIINLMKKYSLYRKGMKILVYSEKKAEEEKIGWHRSGENIQYYRNSLYKFVNDKKRMLSSLCFNYQFEYDNDTVYFANTLPYTYTDVMRELNEIQRQDKKYSYFHRKSLCSTLAGNSLDYFTITALEEDVTPVEEREGVVIMARVHPGETVSSWMMKGVIDFLTSDCAEAVMLRKTFVFKVIPMMNPDGVVTGNYRTSLAGCDLNRRWMKPNEVLHPEIFYSKQMILKFASQRKIGFICDLHGHSGAHNIFMYGNNIKEEPFTCKVFPYILSKISPIFSFPQCAFKMSKYKAGTARINLFNELRGIPNIFTMEASFCGNNKGVNENTHFSAANLIDMGRDLCRAIATYYSTFEGTKYEINTILKSNTAGVVTYANANVSTESSDHSSPKLNNKKNIYFDKSVILNELQQEIEFLEKMRKEKTGGGNLNNSNLGMSLKDVESEGDSEGSDSEPSIDNFENDHLVKLLPTQAKKKKKKIKKAKFAIYSRLSVVKSNKFEKQTESKVNINAEKASSMKQSLPIVVKLENCNNQSIKMEKEKNVIPINNTAKLENKKKPALPNTLVTEREKMTHSAIPNNQPKVVQLEGAVNVNKTKKKKDSETQTEEIFFKMHWSYFHNKGYTTLSAKTSKNFPLPSTNRSFSIENRKRFTFYQEMSQGESGVNMINLLKKNSPSDLMANNFNFIFNTGVSGNRNLMNINVSKSNSNIPGNSLHVKNKLAKDYSTEKIKYNGLKNFNINTGLKSNYHSSLTPIELQGIKGNKYFTQVR